MKRLVLLLLPVLVTSRRPAAAPALHTVRMVGTSFQPRDITIAPGDTVRFELRSGGPHNAAFRDVPEPGAASLRKVMTDTLADLSGPLLIAAGETYEIVFTHVPPGKYTYWCIPHFTGGMSGTITVR